MDKIRLLQEPYTNNTRTITNQIGVDDTAKGTTKRALPVFFDANSINVKKTGLDSNPGTLAEPKLTIQAACDAAYLTGKAYVVIYAGVYDECVDAYGRKLYAAANNVVEIKMPSVDQPWKFDGVSGGASTPSALVFENRYGVGEYAMSSTQSGILFTGTINNIAKFGGLYFMFSSNGVWWGESGYNGWTLVSGLAGKTYRDYVISNNELYAFNQTDGTIDQFIIDARNSDYVYHVVRWSGFEKNWTSVFLGDDTFMCVTYPSGNTMTCKFINNGGIVTSSYTSSESAFTSSVRTCLQSNGAKYIVYGELVASAEYAGFVLSNILFFSDDQSSFVMSSHSVAISEGSPSNLTLRVGAAYSVGENDLRCVVTYSDYGVPKTELHKISEIFTFSTIKFGSVSLPFTASDTYQIKRDADKSSSRVYFMPFTGGLHYCDNIGSENPTIVKAFDYINAADAPAEVIETDIGTMCLTRAGFAPSAITNKIPGFALKSKIVLRGSKYLSGLKINGNYIASVGAMYYTDTSDTPTNAGIYHCEINNCIKYGVKDAGMYGQRSWCYNNYIHDNGVAGIYTPTTGSSLLRLFNNVITRNQHGILSRSYCGEFGPRASACTIFDNSIAGLLWDKVGYIGAECNPIVRLVSQNILWGNGLDLYISPLYKTATTSDVIGDNIVQNYSVPTTSGPMINIDPLVIKTGLYAGSYQDMSSGFPFDSIAKIYTAGAYEYSRASTAGTQKDYTFDYLPNEIATEWVMSGFASTDDARGDYNETFDAVMRKLNLSWAQDAFSTPKELTKYVNIMKMEDTTFMFGKSSNGTDWADQFQHQVIVEECDEVDFLKTIISPSVPAAKHPVVFENELVGYYLKAFDASDAQRYLYLKITGNTTGDGTNAVTIYFEPPTGYYIFNWDTRIELVYLKVKVDKSSAFGYSRYGYVATPDTGYKITLREVTG